MTRTSIFLLSIALAAPAVATAYAQDAGGAQRCGGLLCDMGMFGGARSAANALPCNDFVCRAFGGSQNESAPPPPPVAAASAAPLPKTRKVRKKTAKADIAPDAAAK